MYHYIVMIFSRRVVAIKSYRKLQKSYKIVRKASQNRIKLSEKLQSSYNISRKALQIVQKQQKSFRNLVKSSEKLQKSYKTVRKASEIRRPSVVRVSTCSLRGRFTSLPLHPGCRAGVSAELGPSAHHCSLPRRPLGCPAGEGLPRRQRLRRAHAAAPRGRVAHPGRRLRVPRAALRGRRARAAQVGGRRHGPSNKFQCCDRSLYGPNY